MKDVDKQEPHLFWNQMLAIRRDPFPEEFERKENSNVTRPLPPPKKKYPKNEFKKAEMIDELWLRSSTEIKKKDSNNEDGIPIRTFEWIRWKHRHRMNFRMDSPHPPHVDCGFQ